MSKLGITYKEIISKALKQYFTKSIEDIIKENVLEKAREFKIV